MELLAIGSGVESIQGWMMGLGLPEGLSFLLTALVCILGAALVTVGLMTLLWRNKKSILRDHDLQLSHFKLPALPGISLLNALRIPMPKFSFDLSGGRGIVTALGIVGIAFGIAFTFVIATTDETPVWPEAGAAYSLPSVFGTPLDPDESDPSTRSQTLQINLANGVRLDRLHLKNLDLGKAGLTNSFEINRTQGVTGAQVSVGIITIRNSSAPTLDWANMEAGCINLAGNVDGHTNAIQLDSTIPNLVIDSDRGAGTYVAENSTVDRIVITTNGDSGATIGEILIDDVDASVGAWDWDYLRVGCLHLEASNTFGNATGINVASAVFNSSVKARTVTDNLVDTPVSVK
jgi:hypothetical protein